MIPGFNWLNQSLGNQASAESIATREFMKRNCRLIGR